jgi:hypothetical protein
VSTKQFAPAIAWQAPGNTHKVPNQATDFLPVQQLCRKRDNCLQETLHTVAYTQACCTAGISPRPWPA